MPLYGKIVVIKRDGTDGSSFPITKREITFGRDESCDIRLQLPAVSAKHYVITINDANDAFLVNLTDKNPAILDGQEVTNEPKMLHTGHVFTIIDRSFRFESNKSRLPPSPAGLRTDKLNGEQQTPGVVDLKPIGNKKVETPQRPKNEYRYPKSEDHNNKESKMRKEAAENAELKEKNRQIQLLELKIVNIIADAERTKKELQSENVKMCEIQEKLIADCSNYKVEIENLTTVSESLKVEHQTEINELKSKLEELQRIVDENDNFKQITTGKDAEIAELLTNLQEKDRQLQLSEEKMVHFASESEKLKKELESEYANVNQMKEKLANECAGYQKEVKSFTSLTEQLKAEHKVEVEDLKAKVETLERVIKENRQNEEKYKDVTTRKDHEIAQLTSNLQAKDRQLQLSEEKIVHFETESEKLKKELETEYAKVNQMEEKIANECAGYETEVKSFTSLTEQMKAEHKMEVEDLKATVETLERVIQEHRQNEEKYKDVTTRKDQEIAELTSDLQEKDRQLKLFEEKMASESEKLKKELEAECAKVNQMKEKLADECVGYEKEVKSFTSLTEQLKAEHQEEVENLKAKVGTLEREKNRQNEEKYKEDVTTRKDEEIAELTSNLREKTDQLSKKFNDAARSRKSKKTKIAVDVPPTPPPPPRVSRSVKRKKSKIDEPSTSNADETRITRSRAKNLKLKI